jgi:hypothetical protein
LVYADDVNLLGDNIDTIKRNTQNLINGRKEIGLEVNTEIHWYLITKIHGSIRTQREVTDVLKMWHS